MTAPSVSPDRESLLALQALEQHRRLVERESLAAPRAIAAVEAAIAAERAAVDAARQALREAELHAKTVEAELRSSEDHRGKLRSQQMLVKKNDEYQALGREIEAAEAEVGAAEEKEIAALYAVDERRAALKQEDATRAAAIREHETRLQAARERALDLQRKLADATAAVAEARPRVSAPLLASYDRLCKAGKFPPLVPLKGQVCGGCHMRVSNHIENAVRKGEATATCDQCGRLLFHAE